MSYDMITSLPRPLRDVCQASYKHQTRVSTAPFGSSTINVWSASASTSLSMPRSPRWPSPGCWLMAKMSSHLRDASACPLVRPGLVSQS
eukprot:363132-Chlamydomonas_euryale.AAC.14